MEDNNLIAFFYVTTVACHFHFILYKKCWKKSSWTNKHFLCICHIFFSPTMLWKASKCNFTASSVILHPLFLFFCWAFGPVKNEREGDVTALDRCEYWRHTRCKCTQIQRQAGYETHFNTRCKWGYLIMLIIRNCTQVGCDNSNVSK